MSSTISQICPVASEKNNEGNYDIHSTERDLYLWKTKQK